MICSHCHASNHAGRTACATCGTPLEEDHGASSATVTFNDWSEKNFKKPGLAAPLAPGMLLARYQLFELLGEGGMGVVYKAKDLRLERWVALKLLTAGALAEPEQQARLEYYMFDWPDA